MAVDIRNPRRPSAQRGPDPLLAKVELLEAYLVGPCGRALSFWQRATTRLGLKIALLGTGAAKHIELREDGWHLRVDAAQPDELSLNDRIAVSHARDNASGRARVALRPRAPEASDRYFAVAEDEDTGEVSPVLERFRERTAFQMQRA
jgi:hypothetical protein